MSQKETSLIGHNWTHAYYILSFLFFLLILYIFLFFGKHTLKRFGGKFMEIKKHLIVTGNSTVSWKDAIVKAIAEASKTIDYLSDVRILEQRASISGDKISEYFVDLDISFAIDLNRKDNKDA